MQTIVMTSDKHLHALRPFMWLWQKYMISDWPQENIICGFSEPDFDLIEGFTFYSIGEFEQFPIGRWSDALYLVLDKVADEIFMLMLEDYWLTRPVNTDAIKILYDYMDQFRYVVKMDLCGDRLYSHGADVNYGTVSYLDLVKSMPGSPYHLSLMTGLWNRDLMRQVLIPGESPWDVELAGTTRLSHSDMLVLGTRQWPLKHTLGLRAGEPGVWHLNELRPEDVEEMKDLEIL